MDKYNGRGDPSDHINIYKMKLQGQSPVVKCRNFYTTFISDAKRLYNKLKPGSIWSWPQLKRKLFNAFIGNRTMIADITQLNDIRQKEEETVKSYLKRFSNVINMMKTVTDEKALDALREIRSEETIENRKKAERKRGDHYRRKGRCSPEPHFSRFQKNHSTEPLNSHYKRFNQMDVVPTLLPKAPSMAPLPAVTPSKFCRIHRTRVQNTEDCLDVKELINREAHSQGEENRPVRGRRGPPVQGRRPPPRH
ncbi:Ribonuclease H [Abeliophyllum distichum]|uniref:Ribonuclease H n=1 Tax=Abeliophyllum distichum TaxID=126358 RepID=A0ABD1UP01_9LAMI